MLLIVSQLKYENTPLIIVPLDGLGGPLGQQ